MTITQARLKEVLRYDRKTGVFTWRSTGRGRPGKKRLAAGCQSGRYQRIRIDGVLYHAHRLAWLYVHGEWPHSIDHRRDWHNGLHNLRECTAGLNLANASLRSDNTSGFKGVARLPYGKWKAQIQSKHLGCFATPEEAARCYDLAAKTAWGHFARTNASLGLL